MPPISEKYIGCFPTVLFLCSDNEHSMHIILSLKSMSDAHQKELVELLHHCGARTSYNLKDITGHSIIIVDHNEVVSSEALAFTLEYLKDCLKNIKIQNIVSYRQDITKHLAKNVDFMDVIYFRRQCWDSVFSEAEKQWLIENVVSSDSEAFDASISSTCEILDDTNARLLDYQRSSKYEEFNPRISSTCVLFDEEDSRLGSCNQDNAHSEVINHENYNDTRLSSDEHSVVEDIFETIIVSETKKEATNSHKGSGFERTQIGSTKTSEGNKTVKSVEGFTKSKDGSRVLDKVLPTSTVPSNKWVFLDEFESGESEEEDLLTKLSQKEKKKNFLDFGDDDEVSKPHKDKKHSRMPYSYEEQRNILKYITERSEYSRVKGRELWIVMERRQVCPNRTWQSMKEHFMKKIILRLEAFDFVTEEQKRKLKMFL